MNRTRLYGIVFLACLTGLIWLGFQYVQQSTGGANTASVCMIKHVTGIPCPSCGTTRSIFALMEGNLLMAMQWNPFGLIVMAIMLISPLWILADVIFSRESFFRWYGRLENRLRTKWVALPAVALVLANWIWNIAKGL